MRLNPFSDFPKAEQLC